MYLYDCIFYYWCMWNAITDGIAFTQIWTFSYNLEWEVNEIHNFGRGPQTKRNLMEDDGTFT